LNDLLSPTAGLSDFAGCSAGQIWNDLKSLGLCLNLAADRTTQVFKNQPQTGVAMKNPLDSIVGTIISGLVLTAILIVIVTRFVNIEG